MNKRSKRDIIWHKSQILLFKLCPEAHECSAEWIKYHKKQLKKLLS